MHTERSEAFRLITTQVEVARLLNWIDSVKNDDDASIETRLMVNDAYKAVAALNGRIRHEN